LKYTLADAPRTVSTSCGSGTVDVDSMQGERGSGGTIAIASPVFIFMPLSPRAFACG
jgi:hypothetical protein